MPRRPRRKRSGRPKRLTLSIRILDAGLPRRYRSCRMLRQPWHRDFWSSQRGS